MVYCKDDQSAINLLEGLPDIKEAPLHLLASSHSKSAHHEKLGRVRD